MRKFTILVTVLIIVMISANIAYAVPQVILDNNTLYFDVPPIIENDRILVPMRTIFEALGADVYWDEKTANIFATKDKTSIAINTVFGFASINDIPVNLDVPVKVVNGRTLIPLRFISQAFGCQVNWDEYTQTVNIKSALQIQKETLQQPTSKSSLVDISKYLNINYKTVVTPLGTMDLSYNIWTNTYKYFPYDLEIEMRFESTSIFYDMENKINVSKKDIDDTENILKSHAKNIYDIISIARSGKKIQGSYYRGWYKYPNLKIGHESEYRYSWQNFVKTGDFSPDKVYENAKLTTFHFTPEEDGYHWFD